MCGSGGGGGERSGEGARRGGGEAGGQNHGVGSLLVRVGLSRNGLRRLWGGRERRVLGVWRHGIVVVVAANKTSGALCNASGGAGGGGGGYVLCLLNFVWVLGIGSVSGGVERTGGGEGVE